MNNPKRRHAFAILTVLFYIVSIAGIIFFAKDEIYLAAELIAMIFLACIIEVNLKWKEKTSIIKEFLI